MASDLHANGDLALTRIPTFSRSQCSAVETSFRLLVWNTSTRVAERVADVRRVIGALAPDVVILDEFPADTTPSQAGELLPDDSARPWRRRRVRHLLEPAERNVSRHRPYTSVEL